MFLKKIIENAPQPNLRKSTQCVVMSVKKKNAICGKIRLKKYAICGNISIKKNAICGNISI